MKVLRTARAELVFFPDRVIKRSAIQPRKLDDEVRWLNSLSPQIAGYFPSVRSHVSDCSRSQYEMTRQPGLNLAEHLLSDNFNIGGARRVLNQIYGLIIENWCLSPQAGASFEHFLKNYVQKIRTRYSDLGSKDGLSTILNRPNIELNGRHLTGAAKLLDSIELQEELHSILTPPHLSVVHGDLKLDNIVVDLNFDGFLMIDPRGLTPDGGFFSDPVEDFAKMRTSTLAGYDLVKEGMYCITQIDHKFTCSWNVGRKTWGALSLLDMDLLRNVERYAQAVGDVNAFIRVRYITSMLLIANAPFQIVEDTPEERLFATMLLVIGTSLLNAAHHQANEAKKAGSLL